MLSIMHVVGNCKDHPLPWFSSQVHAGFPSPADDHLLKETNLSDLLIQHPAVTFLVRVSGDSMVNAGIRSGDILVVDRALQAEDQDIIVAIVEGEFCVKRLVKRKNSIILASENDNYQAIVLTEEMEAQAWGVVTCVLHMTTRNRRDV